MRSQQRIVRGSKCTRSVRAFHTLVEAVRFLVRHEKGAEEASGTAGRARQRCAAPGKRAAQLGEAQLAARADGELTLLRRSQKSSFKSSIYSQNRLRSSRQEALQTYGLAFSHPQDLKYPIP